MEGKSFSQGLWRKHRAVTHPEAEGGNRKTGGHTGKRLAEEAVLLLRT